MSEKDQGVASFSPEELLDKIRAGNKAAEHELVTHYWRGLYFILNRRVEDPELAEDIAQETFVVVITKARTGQIENPSALASFVRQVGINIMIDYYRKDSRRKTSPSEHIDVHFTSEQNDYTDTLNQKQVTEVVKQLLDDLPTERDRDLLYRFFVYDQSKTLICSELSLSHTHFDRVLHRARARLKQILQLKLNVETEKLSLTSLLSALLVMYVGTELHSTEISNNQVRGFSKQHHLETITYYDSSRPTV